jgi:hypothetical protein
VVEENVKRELMELARGLGVSEEVSQALGQPKDEFDFSKMFQKQPPEQDRAVARLRKKVKPLSPTNKKIHNWAAKIVDQAFIRVMGRSPTMAERQIVMAVALAESGYGKGWGKGRSTSGEGSHNWGAIQTRSKTTPSFSHGDSSAEGKYVTKFKSYSDDISGAADVVKNLFKSVKKQRIPSTKNKQRAMGGIIPDSPTRSELIENAARTGDTMAFSRAMWYTTYFEGTNKDFTVNIERHALRMQQNINKIANALGEPPAWSIKSAHFLPVTNDRSIINHIVSMNPAADGRQERVAKNTDGLTKVAEEINITLCQTALKPLV